MNEPRQLNRSLGLGMVVVMVIANIIGSGVYKKVAPMANELHSSGWILVCWVLGGVITLFGALCNAEVSGLLADTGGEYVYYKTIYNRFFAFLFGWSLFVVIETAAISSLAYVFAESLNSLVPLPGMLTRYEHWSFLGWFMPFEGFNIKFTAILLIVLLSWINGKGVKTGAGLSRIILLLVCAGILSVILACFSNSKADLASAFSLHTGKGQAVTISAIFTAMLSAFWAYQGWATVGYIGGEVKNAKRNIALGLVIGVFSVIGIYLLVNIAYLSVLPVSQLESIYQQKDGIAAIAAMSAVWGRAGGIFISILIALTTLGCTHATIFACCRMYYAMAKEGLFFPGVEKLDAASVPGRSLLYQCVWACLLVLSGTFDQLTDMIIFAVFIFYAATTFGVIILRRKMPDAPRPYKVWGYPVVPIIVILFCIGLFVNTIVEKPREAVFGLVLMATGVPLYYWFLRRKTGVPKDNIAK